MTTKTPPSRADFKVAFIQALTAMGGVTSDRDALYTKTFEILKFTPSDMGREENSGRCKASKVFNATAYYLKKEGKLVATTRGEYRLAATLQKPKAQVQPKVTKPVVQVKSQPEPEPQIARLADDDAGDGVSQTSLPPKSSVEVDKTVGTSLNLPQMQQWDSYLINLATQSSSCFGTKYSTRSAVCKGCPLSRECQAQRGRFLADLATELEAAVSTGTVSKLFNEAPKAEAKSAPSPSPAPQKQKSEGAKETGYLSIEIEVDGIICEGCGGRIAKGTKDAVCIPGKGTFHAECVS